MQSSCLFLYTTFHFLNIFFLKELVNNMSYNDKSDVWALGCLLYEMCAFHPPFTANNQTELNRKIRIGDFPRIPAKYSSELDRIVRKMIKVEVCASRIEIGLKFQYI